MKRRGFTLIELLVVMGVISLLVSILIPVLSRSRQVARAVVCSGNIRQLGQALQEYTISNRSYPYSLDDRSMPPSGEFVGSASYDIPGWWWFQQLTKTIGENFDRNSVVFCPSRMIRNEPAPLDNPLLGNYGVNEGICRSLPIVSSRREFRGSPLVPEKIKNPGETLLLADSGYAVINWWQVTESPPRTLGNNRWDMSYIPGLSINSGKNVEACQAEDALLGRHPNQSVNVGYADGHVKRVGAETLLVGYENGEYTNSYPLWQVK